MQHKWPPQPRGYGGGDSSIYHAGPWLLDKCKVCGKTRKETLLPEPKGIRMYEPCKAELKGIEHEI